MENTKDMLEENLNILHLKTLKTFNKFDLKFKICYSTKKKNINWYIYTYLLNKWISIDFVKTKI